MNYSFAPTTIPDLIQRGFQQNTATVALCTKRNGEWKAHSPEQVKQLIDATAKAMLTLGIQHGDKVAIHSENSAEWVIIDQAALCIGAVTVPIYTTQPSEQIKFILEDAQAKLFFVSNNALFDTSKAFVKSIPSLKHTIMIWDKAPEGVLHFQELLSTERVAIISDSQLQAAREAVKPDDLSTLMYTSGTTGMPKGVMLTHNNIASNIQTILTYMPFDLEEKRGGISLSFLPLSHSFERAVSYTWLSVGYPIYFIEKMEEIVQDIQSVKPLFFATVPRLLEKMYAGFLGKANEMSGAQKMIYTWAMDKAKAYDLDNPPRGLSYRTHRFADHLVFKKIRAALGGNLYGVISGGAALAPEIMNFMNGIGIYCNQGYGLTETSPVLTCMRLHELRAGTVGKPITDVRIRIEEDGEICAQGPNIMKGYFNLPEETAQSFTEDGWFKTGDIGHFDKHGYLYITDRKKSLFKLSTGKYVAPQYIENMLITHQYIEHVMVIGAERKFCSALIVPDFLAIRKAMKLDEAVPVQQIAQMKEVRAEIEAAIEEANKKLGNWEQLKKWHLLEQPFTIPTGELTPTLKVKRPIVEKKYAEIINGFYL